MFKTFKCKVCGEYHLDEEKIEFADGVICKDCYENLPREFQLDRKHLQVKNVKMLSRLMAEPGGQEVVYRCGSFKVKENCIEYLSRDILYKDIESMAVKFHPKTEFYGKPERWVGGILTLIVNINGVFLEYPLYKTRRAVKFTVWHENAAYEYASHIDEVVRYINEHLKAGINPEELKTWLSSLEIHEEMDASKMNYRYNSHSWERKSSEDSGSSKHSGRSGSSASGSNFGFQEALKVLGLTPGFTKAELRQAYRSHIKECHPDNGGDVEKAQMINQAYAILGKYARQASA